MVVLEEICVGCWEDSNTRFSRLITRIISLFADCGRISSAFSSVSEYEDFLTARFFKKGLEVSSYLVATYTTYNIVQALFKGELVFEGYVNHVPILKECYEKCEEIVRVPLKGGRVEYVIVDTDGIYYEEDEEFRIGTTLYNPGDWEKLLGEVLW